MWKFIKHIQVRNIDHNVIIFRKSEYLQTDKMKSSQKKKEKKT